MSLDRLVTLHRAAELLGVEVRTVRRYIASGQLTGYRVAGHQIRVDLDEIERELVQPMPNAKAGR